MKKREFIKLVSASTLSVLTANAFVGCDNSEKKSPEIISERISIPKSVIKTSKYTLPKNNLNINGLDAFLDGFIQLQEEDILFDLATNSKSPDLNKFLTLIPAIYTSDFGSMQTKGSGKLNATFKGKYGANSFPAYDLKLLVDNGWFKYPDLSLPAEDINLDLHVFSLDGNTAYTCYRFSCISFMNIPSGIP